MKRPTIVILAWVALALALATAGFPGQAPAQRPRIGLVLSGGGARGSAHVGVLKVLEEMRIPVDYVAGTSMGSIVGGLFASGMTSEEIQAILVGVDWDDAMTDSTAREMISFHRKTQEEALTAKVRVGVRDGKLVLPLGILQGQKLEMILREVTLPVATVSDFDRLAVPYRAVAADLETGKAVVLGKGDLATAMRASMSVPAMLSPVEIGGRLLVDGGVIDNMPVGAARDMGADIIIAVDISTALSPLDEITSVTAVNSQVGTMQTRSGTEIAIASLRESDVLIVPDLGDIGFADFNRAAEAVPLGEKAARGAAERLKAFALSPEEWAAYRAAHPKPDRSLPVVREVRIKQNTHLSDQFIRDRLTVKTGAPLDTGTLRRDILDLYGMDIFEKIGYDLVAVDGGVAVELDCRRKSWGPDYFQFGLALQGNFEGANDYNFTLRYNKLAMNARGGEWMTDVRLGENAMLFSEVYQPFSGPGGYFVAPRLYYKRDPVQVYNEEGASSLVTVKRFGGGLDLGRALGNWGEVRLGLDRESQNAKRELGDGAVQELDYEEGRTYLRFGVDTQDRTVFPISGVKAFAQYAYSFEELGADQSMAQAEVAFLGVRTWGRFSASAAIVLGGISEDDPSIPRFKAGGLGRLSGYGLDRIFGNYQGLARVGGHYRVLGLNLGPYDMPVYAGLTLDAGNVWMLEDDISWDSVEYHGAVYLGIDSLAGPIMIAYGRGPEGMNAFYFLMGWPFQ